MSNTPIADYALLSDRHSAALVARSGSVEWLGFPRFDSPSVFGRLLGLKAGHWSITPHGEWTSEVYGELLGAAAQLSGHIETLDEETRGF